MMIDLFTYVDKFENASYLGVLRFKDELVSAITKFEHDFDRSDPDWKIALGPDVHYQWNLEALGLIASMLSKT